MNLFYDLIWQNVCFLRFCTGLFFIFLLHFVWNNNIYNIRKNINHIKKNAKLNLYKEILIKHIFEKVVLICLLLLFTIVFLLNNSAITQSLLGVTVSALVTVLFLDSINQYIAEMKFLHLTTEVRNTIYSMYHIFYNLVKILDKVGFADEDRKYYRNDCDIFESSHKLYSYSKTAKLKHNKELSNEEILYANQYLKYLTNDIELSIKNLSISPSNLEIYRVSFYLNNLQAEFRNVSEKFFSPDENSIANLFGGINESFIRNSLCKYVELLEEIHKNKIMTQIPLTINQKDVFFVQIPNLEINEKLKN